MHSDGTIPSPGLPRFVELCRMRFSERGRPGTRAHRESGEGGREGKEGGTEREGERKEREGVT